MKLIVNYTFQKWTGDKYIDIERAKIIECNIDELTDDRILKYLFNIHAKTVIITKIDKILPTEDK